MFFQLVFIFWQIVCLKNDELLLNKILCRPNASNGLWLCTLLPLSYISNTWKHKAFVQFQGKVSTIVAFGLFLQTLVVLSQLRTNKSKGSTSKILVSLPAAFTSFLIWICLNQGIKLCRFQLCLTSTSTIYLFFCYRGDVQFNLWYVSIIVLWMVVCLHIKGPTSVLHIRWSFDSRSGIHFIFVERSVAFLCIFHLQRRAWHWRYFTYATSKIVQSIDVLNDSEESKFLSRLG